MSDQKPTPNGNSGAVVSARVLQRLPVGMHYFPDALHYREQDLQTWLPELQALGAKSLTLIAPVERAVPEYFISTLLKNNIEPLLHFPLPVDLNYLDEKNRIRDFSTLFENYARWGVRHVVLFDRPNLRRNWPASAWAQPNLTERFLDILLPLVKLASLAGLSPILPPLEPGGDYWDTAFLQSILRGMIRRERGAGKSGPSNSYLPSINGDELIQTLSLGVYAWTYNRPIEWGAGGPERWPASQPYCTPQNSQDQIGFHIFEWYDAIARAETGQAMPIFILRAGSRLSSAANQASSEATRIQHAIQNLEIIRHLSEILEPQDEEYPGTHKSIFPSPQNRTDSIGSLSPKSERQEIPLASNHFLIQTLNFWLLSAGANCTEAMEAWYQPDGNTLPVVNALKQWLVTQKWVAPHRPPRDEDLPFEASPDEAAINSLNSSAPAAGVPLTFVANQRFPIHHYLLLPIYAWGVAEWDLEAIRPFLQQYHPTLGFSLEEARLARRITIYGEPPGVTPEILISLIQDGCQVERINQDGTLLAL